MLVYGDHDERFDAAGRVLSIAAALRDARRAEGLARHTGLVRALVDAGQLWQGLEDAGHAGAAEAVARWAHDLARDVVRSWDARFDASPSAGDGPTLAPGLVVSARIPEGFLHYALYPEVCVEAARRLGPGSWSVVGVRSIGTTLASTVAAALGTRDAVTVRPRGEPFHRRLSEDDAARLPRSGRVAVVDEGPGLSGSTFLAVAAAAEARGAVPMLVPSHAGGPGAMAPESLRARWAATAREVADPEALLGAREDGRGLRAWLEATLGPLESTTDVSGGAWRAELLPRERWPAVSPRDERRKLLVRAEGRTWLAKFVGLGRWGEHRAALARTLAEAGWSPAPRALVHGFLVEPWLEDARPLGTESPWAPGTRAGALLRAAEYLAFRARACPAPEGVQGASLEALWTMVRENVRKETGRTVRARFPGASLAALQARVQPIAQDGRLEPHEWVRRADGTILKTDAVEHHLGHDLVGPQDVAWDVAGLELAWDLDVDERRLVAEVLERRTGRSVDPGLLRACRLAVAAFRLGQLRMAEDAIAADWPEDARGLRVRGDAMRGWLVAELEALDALEAAGG